MATSKSATLLPIAEATTAAAASAPPAAVAAPTLSLGNSVMVQLADPLARLINNESGTFFLPDTPTPQTVTVTLLRRLADRDLVLMS